MPHLNYEGVRLYYADIDDRQDRSRGTTLVLIHGAGTSHEIWSAQFKYFSKAHRIVAPDLSGHGRSEDATWNADVENGYTREVAALIEHLDLHDFVLGGHSMGGGVALAYALNRQLRQPNALLLVSTSSRLRLPEVLRGLSIEVVERLVNRLTGRPKGQVGHGILGSGSIQDSMRSLQRDLEACRQFDVTERLSEIQIPAFVIVGSDDDIFPPQTAKSLARSLPLADIAVVKDADHCPMVEQPVEFNRLLGKFLEWVEHGTHS